MFPFKKKNKITINVKLFAGLDKIKGYDPEHGLELSVNDEIKLKKTLKQVELPNDQPLSFIINGNKVSSKAKLKD